MTELLIRLRALIPDLESNRKTHSEWEDYLTAYPSYSATTKDLGDKAHHVEQVALYDERIAAIKSAITAIELRNGWQDISTFDPKKDGPIVLVAYRFALDDTEYLVDQAFFENGRWREAYQPQGLGDGSSLDTDLVDKWHPLPEPPEFEGETDDGQRT